MIVKAHLNVGFVGAEHEAEIEIDDEEVENLSDMERDVLIEQEVMIWVNRHLNIDWEVVA